MSAAAVAAVVDAAATYRLTRLVVADDVTDKLRQWILDAADDPWRMPPAWVGDVVTCRWCAGVWVGVGVAVARRVAPGPWGLLAGGLAYAAAAALLEQLEP